LIDTGFHYFDHATTSRPKAPGVIDATMAFYQNICASPSRTGHQLGTSANKILIQAREIACEYFGARSPNHIVFTGGATESLNIVIRSVLKKGHEVVISSLAHNAVIRPLARLEESGITVRVISVGIGANFSNFAERFVECFNTRTTLAVLTQASNVDGTVLPIAEITARAKEMGIPVLVDAAQSSGWLSREDLCGEADYFATSLHKGLRGPFGLGILIVGRDNIILDPVIDGGSGLESSNSRPQSVIPNGLETGTMNAAAIAGAVSAFEHAISKEAQEAAQESIFNFQQIMDRLVTLDHIRVFGPSSQDKMVPIVSLQHKHMDTKTFSQILEKKYGILTRVGLHCAPLRHQELGTSPEGTVRISFGHHTTAKDTSIVFNALQNLNKEVL
jgi:selenocysteine lyase/cysteine desulfurase